MARNTLAVTVALTALALPGAAQARDVDVKVMTRNLALGGDILGPATAQTPAEFEQKATELWREVQRNSFRLRAPLIASEIDRHEPDVIGLQEVTLWRRSPDGVKDGQATPSTIVEYDFLALLRRALRRRGLSYRVVEVQQNADVEAPTSLGHDIRLTDHDAILVKRGVRISRPRGGNFESKLTVPTVAGIFDVLRGWTSADVNVRGARFKFVNTHLEAFGHDVRTAQARELVRRGGPAGSSRPVVLLGDMNSDEAYRNDQRDAYIVLTRAGFKDRGGRRDSCCFNDLFRGTPRFDHTVDQILVNKTAIRRVDWAVTGDDPRNRARNGLYPSDHGGVVSELRFQVRGLARRTPAFTGRR